MFRSCTLYIFDLDGTLALIDRRRPILDEKDGDKRASNAQVAGSIPGWPLHSSRRLLLPRRGASTPGPGARGSF